jgi:putative ABC transport system permease protein
MFVTYLWRELRRRARQAAFIALGIALGTGLVITVTAASDGVQNSQASVLHALYGVGTDLTASQPPAQGSGGPTSVSIRQQIKLGYKGATAPGSKLNVNELLTRQYGLLSSGKLAVVASQPGVTAAVGGLTLTDVTVTGTIPSISVGRGGGSFGSSFDYNTFTVDGVDLAHSALGPLSSARLVAGTALTAADARTDDAVADSGYAAQNKLGTGSKVDIGGTTFTIVGIVSAPQGGSPPDLYIPLARAQAVGKNGAASLSGQIDTIYVSTASADDVTSVQKEISVVLPSATVTDASDLAGEITGSLSSASSLAGSLGKWLSVAVLAAAFGLAILLTMAAVTRRVREFGTLKALGWRTTRIIGQVMGESLITGVIGGVVGVGLGYGGAALIDKLAPRLSATVGASSAASVVPPGRTLSESASNAIRALTDTSHTVSVTLTAPVKVSVIGLAVLLAIAGGLLAGSFGGWRAARLRPAAALARIG